MSSIMKFKSIGTSYVCSNNASENFSSDNKLLCGNTNESPYNNSIYKGLITFDISMINPYPIENAYLCLFINNIESNNCYYSNNIFNVYKNTTYWDLKEVNWDTKPLVDSPITFEIKNQDVLNYVKIDVTAHVDYWLNVGFNYGFTIEENNFYSSKAAIASANSANAPLLFIKYKNS